MFFKRKLPELREPIARRVADLEIASSRMIRAGFAGDYHSAFHGRGIEFSQVREYFPGDDIRAIDWNVTARTGVPHVKEFIEERDLTVLIAIDVSGSMAFGSAAWRKCDIAAELASIFAFAAVQNSDRVGLMLFTDSVHTFLPPRRGRSHAQVVVRAAVEAAMRGCVGSADLEHAASYLERVSVKRSVILLLSDFLDLNFEKTLRRLDRKHDVIAISIVDPREETFPDRGLLRLVDAESGEAQLIELKHADVARRGAQRAQQLDRRFRHTGIDHLSVSTVDSYDHTLLRFFKERSAR
ncbi:MAG TPA: DUF58 domain-containing protein [Thermoanaerobaculia bacterium]|nr:DUF58 domain-containing protein [Thermoanaerobaculia bacterium]